MFPNLQTKVIRLQIMQHVRGFVNDDVAIGIAGFVSGPPHVRVVSGKAVTSDFNIVWFEAVIPEQGSEDTPSRSHEAGRQLSLNGRTGSGNERPCGDFTQRGFPPVILHQAGYHRLDSLPNRVWLHSWR